MKPLTNYRSDDAVYSATVCLHRGKYVVQTSTGQTREFTRECDAEAWADDFIYRCNLKLQNDEQKIILKPARGVLGENDD